MRPMKTIRQLELRVTRSKLDERDPVFREPITDERQAIKVVTHILNGLEQEVLLVLHIDSKNRLMSYHEAGRGSAVHVSCSPKEIFRTAILAGAAGIILAHNHPSGVSNPSREDVAFTDRISKGCELLGIHLLDHVIVADSGAYSFLASHLLDAKGRVVNVQVAS